MAIPDYQTLMLPVLNLAGSGEELRFRDMVETLAQAFHLTAEEQSELLPSGSAFLFDNRVGWARTYLKQASLLESPKRGVLRITDRGKAVLASHPTRIDVKFLDQFAEFASSESAARKAAESTRQPRMYLGRRRWRSKHRRSALPLHTRHFVPICRSTASNR
jgi:restriction system protein